MTDPGEEVGSVKVQITKRAVHVAVRNLLKNEFQLDGIAIRNELRKHADLIIKKEVLDYIAKSGWGTAELTTRVNRAIEHTLKDIMPLVKESVQQLVHEKIREEIEGVVEAIVRDGMEVRVGWNRKAKVKVAMAEPKEEKPA